MRFVDLIEKKTMGEELSKEETTGMVAGFVEGDIPDYQMSAMLMALRQNGMSAQETAELTLAMMHSGDVVDLSDLPGVKLDKHSTGGVGDTTTLVIAPLVAACGGTVAKMSGRGLGHTGGTIDKMESIPGCCIEQSMENFKRIVRETGVAVIGQTGNLVPADKKMYALRDVTATVKSIPLIASSVMSKKLASGADAIVLDVKTGTGAFMETPDKARELAKLMVDIGALVGRRVSALITDMNQPLSMAVGNALEVREAVQLLGGKIEESEPLYEVCMLLAEQMLCMAGIAETETEARAMLKEKIENGEGLKKLQRMVELLGGDSSYLTLDRIDELCKVKRKIDVKAEKSGYISSMHAESIGTAAQMLGAGRATKEDVIDPAVGLVMNVRLGDRVRAGDSLATLYLNRPELANAAIDRLQRAIVIGQEKPELPPLIYAAVSQEGVLRDVL